MASVGQDKELPVNAAQQQQATANNNGVNNSSNNTTTKQMSIHVREDSDTDMQQMFDIALNKGGQRSLCVPMRMRNLPASFWQPPTLGSKSPSLHSRENSLDNSISSSSPSCGGNGPFSPGGPATAGNGVTGQQQGPAAGGHHNRANSCPATLEQTLAVAQQQNHTIQNHHLRQQSYDVGGGAQGGDELGPLPPGWEMAKAPNGQIYFMNHITKTTQWEDPRKAIQQQMLNQMNGTASPRSSAVSSPVSGDQALPQGWEQSVTPEGDVYFIHHVTKRTTWYDPRMPIHAQQVPVKQGQESALSQAQKLQQERRLRRLENERRVLQLKRAELNQFISRQQDRDQVQQAVTQTQEMMMRHSLSEAASAAANNTNSTNSTNTNNAVNNAVNSPTPTTVIIGTSGPNTKMVDPFLTQQQANAAAGVSNVSNGVSETHNRQESADSGLGMGSNYNLGIISEDVGMESMDADLDTTLTDSNQQQQQIQPTGQTQQQSMETEELIPTLPELGEELSRDFMNTIFSTNNTVENELTWL